MTEKKKYNKPQRLITEAGIAQFPWLSQPDTKFNAEGEYRIRVRFSGEAAENMKAMIQSEYDKAIEKIKAEKLEELDTPAKKKAFRLKMGDLPLKQVLDEDGNETDEVDITFKQKATIKTKEGTKNVEPIPVFDAKGKQFKVPVYSGSTVKVAFSPVAFFSPMVGAGVSLRLGAVQVLELVSANGRAGNLSGGVYGFGEEEGFEAGDDDVQPFEASTPSAGASDATQF